MSIFVTFLTTAQNNVMGITPDNIILCSWLKKSRSRRPSKPGLEQRPSYLASHHKQSIQFVDQHWMGCMWCEVKLPFVKHKNTNKIKNIKILDFYVFNFLLFYMFYAELSFPLTIVKGKDNPDKYNTNTSPIQCWSTNWIDVVLVLHFSEGLCSRPGWEMSTNKQTKRQHHLGRPPLIDGDVFWFVMVGLVVVLVGSMKGLGGTRLLNEYPPNPTDQPTQTKPTMCWLTWYSCVFINKCTL